VHDLVSRWPSALVEVTSAASLKYLYGVVRENWVCAHSRWDCGVVTGTC
jgi:hypothetical protein